MCCVAPSTCRPASAPRCASALLLSLPGSGRAWPFSRPSFVFSFFCSLRPPRLWPASTRPVYCVICLSMPSPLALQDACPEYRNHLTPAWQIDKKWQLMEPGECRPVISKLQAAVSSGLLWGWDDWVAVTLIGFIEVLTCAKLKGRVVRIKVYVCCTQQS